MTLKTWIPKASSKCFNISRHSGPINRFIVLLVIKRDNEATSQLSSGRSRGSAVHSSVLRGKGRVPCT